MKFVHTFFSRLRIKTFLVIHFGTIAVSLMQVHCQGEGGSAAIGVANPELIKQAIAERHGDNRVDKMEYTRMLPVVVDYMEEHEGGRGYTFKTGIEFWTERNGTACYYASVGKMNSAGIPIRIYAVLINCEGQVLSHNLVL